jgi:hypothetical protein
VDSQAMQQETSLEIEPIVLDMRAAEVYAWRLEELQRAGYDTYAIELAEDHTIDLHVACDLRKNGCPEQTAFLILT